MGLITGTAMAVTPGRKLLSGSLLTKGSMPALAPTEDPVPCSLVLELHCSPLSAPADAGTLRQGKEIQYQDGITSLTPLCILTQPDSTLTPYMGLGPMG